MSATTLAATLAERTSIQQPRSRKAGKAEHRPYITYPGAAVYLPADTKSGARKVSRSVKVYGDLRSEAVTIRQKGKDDVRATYVGEVDGRHVWQVDGAYDLHKAHKAEQTAQKRRKAEKRATKAARDLSARTMAAREAAAAAEAAGEAWLAAAEAAEAIDGRQDPKAAAAAWKAAASAMTAWERAERKAERAATMLANSRKRFGKAKDALSAC